MPVVKDETERALLQMIQRLPAIEVSDRKLLSAGVEVACKGRVSGPQSLLRTGGVMLPKLVDLATVVNRQRIR